MIVPTALNIQRVIAAEAKGFFQWHFKHRRYLINTGVILQAGRDNAHHRRHLETGHAVHRREDADNLDGLRWDRHLFLRFTQRRGNQRGIAAVYRAAGESDLTGMFA